MIELVIFGMLNTFNCIYTFCRVCDLSKLEMCCVIWVMIIYILSGAESRNKAQPSAFENGREKNILADIFFLFILCI